MRKEGNWPIRLAALGGAGAVGLLIFALKVVIGVESEPTRDVVTELDVHVWTGGISTAGLVVWGIVAGFAGVTGLALWRRGEREHARFFLVTGVVIGLVGFDDALLLHDDVIPERVGIEERYVYLAITGLGVAWAVRFRSTIREADLVLLGFAAAGFGLATVMDLLNVWSEAGEDWLKYVGLFMLGGWVIDASLRFLVPDLSELRPTRAPGGGTPPPAR